MNTVVCNFTTAGEAAIGTHYVLPLSLESNPDGTRAPSLDTLSQVIGVPVKEGYVPTLERQVGGQWVPKIRLRDMVIQPVNVVVNATVIDPVLVPMGEIELGGYVVTPGGALFQKVGDGRSGDATVTMIRGAAHMGQGPEDICVRIDADVVLKHFYFDPARLVFRCKTRCAYTTSAPVVAQNLK